jgi:hypothetical protein
MLFIGANDAAVPASRQSGFTDLCIHLFIYSFIVQTECANPYMSYEEEDTCAANVLLVCF